MFSSTLAFRDDYHNWACVLSCAFRYTSGKKLPMKATMIINIIITNLNCSVERVSVGPC